MNTTTGMTLKQFGRARFWRALENYRAALMSGESEAIIGASLAIHAAQGSDGVPKSYRRHVTRTFSECAKARKEQAP